MSAMNVASHSGRTALAVSQQRSFVPIVGISSSEETLRQMCLYWGVTPLRNAPATDMQALIRHIDDWACRIGCSQRGDRIVIVGGSHLAAGPGGEDMAAGVQDVLTKSIGTSNPHNVVHATMVALAELRRRLDEILDEFGIAGHFGEAERAEMTLWWHQLDPWPDSVPGLRRLGRKHLIGPLSNGSTSG